jgi:hypothetical protein
LRRQRVFLPGLRCPEPQQVQRRLLARQLRQGLPVSVCLQHALLGFTVYILDISSLQCSYFLTQLDVLSLACICINPITRYIPFSCLYNSKFLRAARARCVGSPRRNIGQPDAASVRGTAFVGRVARWRSGLVHRLGKRSAQDLAA